MIMQQQIHLILGGANSGKTSYGLRLGEALAEQYQVPKYYIATAQACDDDMAIKIKEHQKERHDWITIEEAIHISAVLPRESDAVVMIDCLTLWVNNIFYYQEDKAPIIIDEFLHMIQHISYPLIIISNETSMGQVPMNTLARHFQQYIGKLHQNIASIATHAQLIVAGYPISLKS